jgi:hypothetical protein
MPVIAALIACGILACLALLHLALIVGAPLGRFAWGGGEDVLGAQQRLQSAVGIVGLAIGAVILLDTVGILRLLTPLVAEIACFVVGAVCFVLFVVHGVSRNPSERALGTPVFLVLAALCLFVGVTGHLVR